MTEEGTGLPVTTGSVSAIPFGIDTFKQFSVLRFSLTAATPWSSPPGQYVLQTNGHSEHVREAWPDLTCVDPQYLFSLVWRRM